MRILPTSQPQTEESLSERLKPNLTCTVFVYEYDVQPVFTTSSSQSDGYNVWHLAALLIF